MKKFKLELTPELISKKIPGEIKIVNEVQLNNVAEFWEANSKSVCFLSDKKFLKDASKSKGGLIFVSKDIDCNLLKNKNLLIVEQAYTSFMLFVREWIQLDKKNVKYISDSATISSTVRIGKNVTIKANVVIGENCIIGDESTIESNSVLMDNVVIGIGCVINPNVTIYEDCILGDRVILHAGVVIGADGFGYLLYDGKQEKIPQVGNVILEDDVEIGANTSIDRATISSTIIGKGTKIDNLVQIGHNCKIGSHSIICGQVGLAGSTIIGNYTYIAGQVGTAGHIKIGDRVLVGAQSGVTKNVANDKKLWGTPAISANIQKKILVSLPYLPEMRKQIKKLQKK